jgi:hypothetical protein
MTNTDSPFEIPEKAIKRSAQKIVDNMKPWINRIPEIGFDDKANAFLVRTMCERIEGLQIN